MLGDTNMLIIFSADAEGKDAGHWYGYATPYDVSAFLDQHTAKGEIIENMWREQIGASIEEAEKVDETEKKIPNGKHVEEAVKPNGDGINKKTRFTVCEAIEGSEFADGDILIFPEMIKYRGLKESDVDGFVEDVLVKGKPWASGAPEVLTGSHVFVCAHASRDMRCGVCGPALIEKFKEEIDSRGLNDQVFVSGCSHVGEHKYDGNLIIFSADVEGKIAGHWYGYATPNDVAAFLDQLIAKGEIIKNLWSYEYVVMGASVEEAEKVDETEKKIPNGKHVEEAVKPNGDGKKVETEIVAGCCQGANAVSCCRDASPEERETSEEIEKKGEGKLSWLIRKLDSSEVYAAVAVVGAVATVAVAYSFYKRGQMGASVEEAEKVDETEMKALNGKHVEEAVKPNGDGKQAEPEIVASCCQGANAVSCCRDASSEERDIGRDREERRKQTLVLHGNIGFKWCLRSSCCWWSCANCCSCLQLTAKGQGEKLCPEPFILC